MDREISKEVRQKEQRKQFIKLGAGIGIAVVLIGGVIGFMQTSLQRKDLVFSTVDKGVIEVSVSASGKVVPAFEEIINSPINSRIVEIYKKGGDSVDVGTPILKLDLLSAETDYKKQLDEEQMKRLQLDQLRIQNRNKLSEMEMQLKVSRMELNRKEVELRNERYLDSLGAGTTDKVRQVELDYNVSVLKLKEDEQKYENEKSLTDADYKVKELDLNIFRKSLAETKRTLEDAQIRSPRKAILTLTGRYTLSGGLMKYALPVIAAKEFAIDNGSYVEWTGNPMDPMLNFKATDRIRASVSEGENGGSRMVNFDVSVVVKNRLDNLSFAFDVAAPEDATVQNELTAMGAEERGKQALYIMVMKTYLGTGPIGGGGGGLGKLNMGSALTSVLSSQINSLMGNLKNASLSVGVEDHDDSETGSKRTDYSFRYSQRLFNNRFQIVIGGKVSQGENATNDAESFIDNISLEYRLDRTGTRYIRLFYDKNYESVLEGEITETGVGIVLRKKLDKLSELFIFKKKK